MYLTTLRRTGDIPNAGNLPNTGNLPNAGNLPNTEWAIAANFHQRFLLDWILFLLFVRTMLEMFQHVLTLS